MPGSQAGLIVRPRWAQAQEPLADVVEARPASPVRRSSAPRRV